MLERRFVERIATEAEVSPEQVVAVVDLFDGGATIPFIARYRKDVTGALDETKLEAISERDAYYSSLVNRRKSILESIAKQGKLTDELSRQIEECVDKTTLEDLYLPYRKKQRTKASIAREKGLEPLADYLWDQVPRNEPPELYAESFMDGAKQVSSGEEALEGARNILAERITNDPAMRAAIRDRMFDHGAVTSKATKNAENKKTKFDSYYDFSESVSRIPSHRFLAIHRGVKEGFLRMDIVIDDETMCRELLARILKEPDSAFAPHIGTALNDAYNHYLRPAIEREVTRIVHRRADQEAVHVFRENAENLLLAPPAGQIVVMGVDPGLRSGCKVAVVGRNGDFLETATVHPLQSEEEAGRTVAELISRHGVEAVAIGNGTGAREASAFVNKVLKTVGDGKVFSVLVNESGASVYSASKLARQEFPDQDVTVRGAISIARRLQDPLSELVKIDPKSIGVGQYQHDVNQKELREGLQRTVASCVNRVGVELNTASAPLLRYVSGISSSVAQALVEARTKLGAFSSRQQLLDVDGIGPRIFEQCAGFLRISEAANPLDTTSIHPEAYPVVEAIAGHLDVPVTGLIAKPDGLKGLDLSQFASGVVGAMTLEDMRRELIKPGRDPRKEFRVPRFLEGVTSVADLEAGMVLEGVVTNVTDFGAFVDTGVHQDGLVHLSELARRYVRDPREVVKVGDIVKVKVIKVDKETPRISLSMKALLPPPRQKAHGSDDRQRGAQQQQTRDSDSRDRREKRDRKPRQERDKTRGKDRGKPERKNEPPARKGDSGTLTNTQLADQLAALKGKFKS